MIDKELFNLALRIASIQINDEIIKRLVDIIDLLSSKEEVTLKDMTELMNSWKEEKNIPTTDGKKTSSTAATPSNTDGE